MGDQGYIWVPGKFDCRGGINQNPEEAEPNQLLDARNVWCPNGMLEQRPGYEGVISDGAVIATPSAGTNAVLIGEDVDAGTFDIKTAADLDLSSYPARASAGGDGDRWYMGFTDDPTNLCGIGFAAAGAASGNSNAVYAQAEYWNGSEWARLACPEFNAAYISAAGSYVFNSLGEHLGGYTANNVTTYFGFVPPNDWTKTTVSSHGTSSYFLRFVLIDMGDSALDADTKIDRPNGNGLYVVDGTGFDMVGLAALQFPSCKHYVSAFRNESNRLVVAERTALSGSFTGTLFYSNAEEAPSDEPASIVAVPQFEQGFLAYHRVVVELKKDHIGTLIGTRSEILATVEDRPEHVGTIGGIKSPYHPDYVAQLGAFPSAKYLEFFHGQLWAANLANEPFTVRWSAAQPSHKVWPAVSYELLMEDDNSPITGLKAFGEHLAVFKQDSIWRMVFAGVGSTADLNTYVPVKVPGGIGTVSNSSIADINGVLIFLAEDGVYAFDGISKPEKISGPIDETIARITPGKRQQTVAVHWRSQNCYLLSVSLDGNQYNNHVLVYDYGRGGWWIWDSWNVRSWLIDEGVHDDEQLYFGDFLGRIYRVGGRDDDYGSAITSYFKSHRIGGKADETFAIREVRIQAQNPDISSLDIDVIRDDQDDADKTSRTMTFVDSNETKLGAFTLGTHTLAGDKRRKRKSNLRLNGEHFIVKVTNDEKGDKLRISDFKVGLVRKGKR